MQDQQGKKRNKSVVLVTGLTSGLGFDFRNWEGPDGNPLTREESILLDKKFRSRYK